MEKNFCVIEEKMKAIEGSSAFGLDAVDMCLVPGVKTPAKFKIPDFEKYITVSYPMTHVRSYCRKMVAYSDDEKMLMHFSRIASVGPYPYYTGNVLGKLHPFPSSYDANARCEFHSSSLRHTIENCKALKHKVHDLIDSKAILFTPNGPNVNNSRMPPHADHYVSML